LLARRKLESGPSSESGFVRITTQRFPPDKTFIEGQARRNRHGIFDATCVPAGRVYTETTHCANRLQYQARSGAFDMSIHLQSADVVAVIAIALLAALMLAMRFGVNSWRGVFLQALIANIGAIAAVLAFELMTT
jgi:hypothetical protein